MVTPKGKNNPRYIPPPPKEEIEGMTTNEIVDEYDVTKKKAVDWQREYGLYEYHTDEAGKYGLSRKLDQMSVEEFDKLLEEV